MVEDNRGLKLSIGYALEWLGGQNYRIPPAIADMAMSLGIKTSEYFDRVLGTWVYDLWNSEITQDEFVDKMADLIEQQMTRAWNEGMRANGLNPADITPEQQAELQNIISDEYMFVDRFAADIVAGRGGSVAQFQSRASLWSNRYNDTVNEAKLSTAEPKDKLIWVYGDTEHCETCAQLNGIVASANEWEQSGIRPQSPPNDNLTCGGWKCQCRLEPTERRRSPKALDTLMNIVIGRGL